jgi:hypothetical protein
MRRDSTEKVMIWNYKGGDIHGDSKVYDEGRDKAIDIYHYNFLCHHQICVFVYTLDVFTWIFRIKDAKILTLYVSSILVKSGRSYASNQNYLNFLYRKGLYEKTVTHT